MGKEFVRSEVFMEFQRSFILNSMIHRFGMKFLLMAFVFFTGCHKVSTNQVKPISKRFVSGKAGKLKSYMDLKIHTSLPDSSSLLLSASIEPFEDFGLAQVEWEIPKHLEVREGLVQQELELKQGQTYQVNLTLNTRQLKSGDQIFLFVYKMENGERYGTTASYTY